MAEKAHELTSSPASQARLQAAIAALHPEPANDEKPVEPVVEPGKADAVQDDKPPVEPPKPADVKPTEEKAKPGDLAAALAEKHAAAKRNKSMQLELDRVKAENAELRTKVEKPTAPDPAKYISREEVAADPLRFLLSLGLDAKRGQQMAEDLYYLVTPDADPAKRASAQARAATYRVEDHEKRLQEQQQTAAQKQEAWFKEQQKQQAVLVYTNYALTQLPGVKEESHPLVRIWAEDKPQELATFLANIQVAHHEQGGKEPLAWDEILDGVEDTLSKDPVGARHKSRPKAAVVKVADKKQEAAGISDQTGTTKPAKALKDMTAEERLQFAITEREREARRQQQQ